jgi:hypothetical protein
MSGLFIFLGIAGIVWVITRGTRGCEGDCNQGRKECDCGHDHH